MITEAVIIDIETSAKVSQEMLGLLMNKISAPANYKDKDKIEKYIEEKKAALLERAALSPLTGEVAVVGLAWRAQYATSWEHEVLDASAGEETLLRALDERMPRLDTRRIVTFNGGRFDLPFLAARYAIRGMSSYPWPAPRDRQHLDLFAVLGEQGSLDQWAIAMGMPTKDIKSADMPALVAAGEWEAVREHCLGDVLVTAALYERVAACMRL